mgnify:CR=1 FL=1
MNYDFIGDIHGHREELELLFEKLGYEKRDGEWYPHANVTPVFLGDFIDRGPDSRGVVDIVRPMIESGRALAVMGNHEYNAICYWSRIPTHGYLRSHNPKNVKQHAAFLCQYMEDTAAWADVVDWFMTLPLFLELDEGPRVVHACWDQTMITEVQQSGDVRMSPAFLLASARKTSREHAVIEQLLKGPEEKVAPFVDEDGIPRTHARVKWWREYTAPRGVVFGHYWMEPDDEVNPGNRWICVDLSVAKEGALACYQWRNEEQADGFSRARVMTVPAVDKKGSKVPV